MDPSRILISGPKLSFFYTTLHRGQCGGGCKRMDFCVISILVHTGKGSFCCNRSGSFFQNAGENTAAPALYGAGCFSISPSVFPQKVSAASPEKSGDGDEKEETGNISSAFFSVRNLFPPPSLVCHTVSSFAIVASSAVVFAAETVSILTFCSSFAAEGFSCPFVVFISFCVEFRGGCFFLYRLTEHTFLIL
jgi:hypothetical protein